VMLDCRDVHAIEHLKFRAGRRYVRHRTKSKNFADEYKTCDPHA
jgi:hypothetical protein